jgi:hypothetical protein
MGKTYPGIETDNKIGAWDFHFSATDTWGIKMPAGEQVEGGELAGNIVGGMFWPMTQDAKGYTMGLQTSLSSSGNIKLDLGGDISWGLVGLEISFKNGFSVQIGFEDSNWGAWALSKAQGRMSSTPLALDADGYNIGSSLAQTIAEGFRGKIIANSTASGITKLQNEIENNL